MSAKIYRIHIIKITAITTCPDNYYDSELVVFLVNLVHSIQCQLFIILEASNILYDMLRINQGWLNGSENNQSNTKTLHVWAQWLTSKHYTSGLNVWP